MRSAKHITLFDRAHDCHHFSQDPSDPERHSLEGIKELSRNNYQTKLPKYPYILVHITRKYIF